MAVCCASDLHAQVGDDKCWTVEEMRAYYLHMSDDVRTEKFRVQRRRRCTFEVVWGYLRDVDLLEGAALVVLRSGDRAHTLRLGAGFSAFYPDDIPIAQREGCASRKADCVFYRDDEPFYNRPLDPDTALATLVSERRDSRRPYGRFRAEVDASTGRVGDTFELEVDEKRIVLRIFGRSTQRTGGGIGTCSIPLLPEISRANGVMTCRGSSAAWLRGRMVDATWSEFGWDLYFGPVGGNRGGRMQFGPVDAPSLPERFVSDGDTIPSAALPWLGAFVKDGDPNVSMLVRRHSIVLYQREDAQGPAQVSDIDLTAYSLDGVQEAIREKKQFTLSALLRTKESDIPLTLMYDGPADQWHMSFDGKEWQLRLSRRQ